MVDLHSIINPYNVRDACSCHFNTGFPARVFPNLWIAYVMLERASANASKGAVKLNIMDHFPTNWGRPVSLRLKYIVLC